MPNPLAERVKEYQRTYKLKKSDEVPMSQVAYFFIGLYAVIHLLQFFDFWTLLLVGAIGYLLYGQIQTIWASSSTTPEAGGSAAGGGPPSGSPTSGSKPKPKSSGRMRKE
mmetsp:Transcript_37897/g.57146  ORF Transcript_37897/g.57146 Transcript_37897/m.57146 type:complete len:110 (+) Transcript_37897:124-453(+)|eukprot:CAMPEP_0194749414 /NCGR_PEP_ID=MMETSP0323_2-20130528/3607_1 /TAXON_ID=2866 ORGANISM="Crypthecodinium cohnii, Strain Seligo" /NCGR_SAMPLE_ID=MMETSP0323_2 /ASSEMBLY_ACC=CAM_ASM_000346 /LENGTH=109 /DNA_ID=CAMNT_0039664497 /DNA_START=138 /DNA_END=467 /DNA_ORIENTATION=+